MDTGTTAADHLRDEIRQALLMGEPRRAAELLGAWMQLDGATPLIRQLARALDELGDAWPEWLDSNDGSGLLRGLARHPLLTSRLLH